MTRAIPLLAALALVAACAGGGDEGGGVIALGTEIYVTDADGENVEGLTENDVWDTEPAWRP